MIKTRAITDAAIKAHVTGAPEVKVVVIKCGPIRAVITPRIVLTSRIANRGIRRA